MHFMIHCRDRSGAGDLRANTRPDHLAYLDGFADQLAFAGPILASDGETVRGSIIIIDQPDQKAAEAFAAGDPYSRAGLFETVTIEPCRMVFPKS